MPHRIMKLMPVFLIALAFALMGTAAQAQPPCHGQTCEATQPRQSAHLIASPKVQTWVSRDIPGNVAVFITDVHGEVEQQWVSGCAARYIDPTIGLFVKVHIQNCHSPGGGPYVVRYFSRGGRKPFTFWQIKEPHPQH